MVGKHRGILLGAFTKDLHNRAVADSYTLLPSDSLPEPASEASSNSIPIDYIQGSRHMLEMTRNLFEDTTKGADVRYQRVDKQLGSVSCDYGIQVTVD